MLYQFPHVLRNIHLKNFHILSLWKIWQSVSGNTANFDWISGREAKTHCKVPLELEVRWCKNPVRKQRTEKFPGNSNKNIEDYQTISMFSKTLFLNIYFPWKSQSTALSSILWFTPKWPWWAKLGQYKDGNHVVLLALPFGCKCSRIWGSLF